MSTIDSLLRYNLTESEIKALYECGICNGIGGKGNNLEKVLQDNLRLLPGYDENKHGRLMRDITSLSVCHDIDFRLKLGFYKANFRFARGMFGLTHWTSFFKRLGIAGIVFVLLCKYGKEYYYK